MSTQARLTFCGNIWMKNLGTLINEPGVAGHSINNLDDNDGIY